jgi:hypothetical protein
MLFRVVIIAIAIKNSNISLTERHTSEPNIGVLYATIHTVM